jgi:hypothetical protein
MIELLYIIISTTDYILSNMDPLNFKLKRYEEISEV